MTIHKFWGAAWLLILSPAMQAQFLLQHDGGLPVVRDTVTLAMPWVGGLNWCQVSQADMDLDGEKDLFIFDRSGNEVIALIHQGGPGSSTYTYDPIISTTWPFNELESWAYLREMCIRDRHHVVAAWYDPPCGRYPEYPSHRKTAARTSG